MRWLPGTINVNKFYKDHSRVRKNESIRDVNGEYIVALQTKIEPTLISTFCKVIQILKQTVQMRNSKLAVKFQYGKRFLNF